MSERIDQRRRGRTLALVVALGVALALGGCGVSTTGSPVDIGDPASLGGGSSNDSVRQPDGPSEGGTPEKLVQLYLQAAAGGDNGAPGRMREFLTGKALQSFREPDNSGQAQTLPLTIIRIIGVPTRRLAVEGRTPVDIRYQVVGSLNDQGLVTDLSWDASVTYDMTFYVTADEKNNNRIDQIEGANTNIQSGLLLSDDALQMFYRLQPIYFWDSPNADARLIPDLRYLPLTLGPDQRAQRLVQWLLVGASTWLTAAPLPRAVLKDGVTNQSGTWVINLSAPAGASGPEAVRRLYYQLEWSLRVVSTPSIALSIEGKPQQINGAPDDYLRYNLSAGLDQVKQQSYDIVDGKLVALRPSAGIQPSIVKAPGNKNVVYAAVNRAGDAAALVHSGTDGKRSLQIVRDPDGAAVDARISTKTGTPPMGRPVWIPGTNLVLVTVGGEVWSVQSNGDAFDITTPRTTGIKSLSVSPDGRRIAWIQGDNAYVAPLIPDGTSVNIGGPMPVLPNQIKASGIAWTSEAWLSVVGTNGGKGAMWQTTVDGAVAKNVSDGLQEGTPTDVVALANGPAQNPGEVYLSTSKSWYVFRPPASAAEPTLKNPFFVT